METITITFMGMFMIIGGAIFGAVLIIVSEMLLESWIEKYKMWKFKRKF